jgi:hypothetical protein
VDFLDIAASEDPGPPQRRQPLFDVALETFIAPRPRAIVKARRFIGFDAAVERFGRTKLDFTERDADVRMDFARHVNPAGIGQGLTALRLEGVSGRDHDLPFVRTLRNLFRGGAG